MSTENRVTDERLEGIRQFAARLDWCIVEEDRKDWDAAFKELQYLRSKPVAGVEVKPLEWHGPDVHGEFHARSILCVYSIRANMGSLGHWLTEVGGYHPSVDEAKAAAEADYRQRILSTLSLPAQEPVRDPALAYQEAEEAICECGAAGSGEGHSDFCPWLESPWKRWGDAFDASPQPEAVIPEEMAERVWLAVLDCPHTITGQEIILRHAVEKEGRNAANQLRERITAALKEA